MPKNVELFKNHQLPLARIKKIMKSDEDVRVPLFKFRWSHPKHPSFSRRHVKFLSLSWPTEHGRSHSSPREGHCKYLSFYEEKRRVCMHIQYWDFWFLDRHYSQRITQSPQKIPSIRYVPDFTFEQRKSSEMIYPRFILS